MNRLNKLLAATFTSVAMFLTGAAQAMPIWQFDKMAAQDRQDYMNLLVEGTQKVLIDQGQRDVAAKVYQLFHEIRSGDHMPLGEAELELNLDSGRVRDAERVAQNSHAQRAQVESALTGTLKRNGIALTPDFYKGFVQLTSTFKSKFPPLDQKDQKKK